MNIFGEARGRSLLPSAIEKQTVQREKAIEQEQQKEFSGIKERLTDEQSEIEGARAKRKGFAKKLGRVFSGRLRSKKKSEKPKRLSMKKILKKAVRPTLNIRLPREEKKEFKPFFKRVVEQDRRNFFFQ